MTRIISGTAKGQRIKVPATGTRPTSDRIREALFSSIDSWLLSQEITWADAHFVDLFGGSGAIGLEAKSRGARGVCIVESQPLAARLITENSTSTDCLVEVSRQDAYRWTPNESVTILFADPPYGDSDSVVRDLFERFVAAPEAAGALIICERGRRSGSPWSTETLLRLERSWEKKYGDTVVWYGHVVSPENQDESSEIA